MSASTPDGANTTANNSTCAPAYETYTTICHAYSTGSPDFVTELAPPPSVCTEVQSTQESCSYGTPGFETLAPEVQAECLCYSDGTFSEDFDAEDLECASYVSTAIPALYDRMFEQG